VKLIYAEDEFIFGQLDVIAAHYDRVDFEHKLSALQKMQKELKPQYIGFVGKVSSGKSSLINSLLGYNLVPSGISSVTAVPTEITSVFGNDNKVIQFKSRNSLSFY
jgi:ribosome biogenesis GTPase A